MRGRKIEIRFVKSIADEVSSFSKDWFFARKEPGAVCDGGSTVERGLNDRPDEPAILNAH
jgi:hypothetical protein